MRKVSRRSGTHSQKRKLPRAASPGTKGMGPGLPIALDVNDGTLEVPGKPARKSAGLPPGKAASDYPSVFREIEPEGGDVPGTALRNRVSV